MAKRKIFRTERLGAISDGVFAIAMTLLVLDLKMPDAPEQPFVDVLGSVFPKIEGWAFSFFVIGATWVLHHNLLSWVKRTTTAFLWLNLFFLMMISFMPWPSWLLGLYRHQPLAICLFSGTIGMAGLVMTAQWLYAAHGSWLTDPRINLKSMKTTTFLILRIPLVAAISIFMSLVDTRFALVVWLIHPILGFVIRRISSDRVEEEILLAQ